MMYELKTLTDYSDEALLEEMRRVATAFTGKRLTREEFAKISRVYPSTLERRFGSWANALDRAGISQEIAPRPRHVDRQVVVEVIRAFVTEHGRAPTLSEISHQISFSKNAIINACGSWPKFMRELGLQSVPLGRRYTDEECFENIIRLWAHYGRQPTIHETKHQPSTVGAKAYIRRWGGWRPALAAFIAYVNDPQNDNLQDSEISVSSAPDTTDSDQDDAAHMPPRTLSLGLRYRVLSRDRFKCQICGRSPAKDPHIELHVDHIIPWSKGGENIETNLRALCSDCNLGKGAKNEAIDCN